MTTACQEHERSGFVIGEDLAYMRSALGIVVGGTLQFTSLNTGVLAMDLEDVHRKIPSCRGSPWGVTGPDGIVSLCNADTRTNLADS